MFIQLNIFRQQSRNSIDEIKKYAEQGNADAQDILGSMYLQSNVTLKDYKQAFYWIKKAYKNGLDSAKQLWNEYELWKY